MVFIHWLPRIQSQEWARQSFFYFPFSFSTLYDTLSDTRSGRTSALGCWPSKSQLSIVYISSKTWTNAPSIPQSTPSLVLGTLSLSYCSCIELFRSEYINAGLHCWRSFLDTSRRCWLKCWKSGRFCWHGWWLEFLDKIVILHTLSERFI